MSSFDIRMAQLRDRFISRAAEERVQLAAALDPLDREAIRQLSHSLSGSGGTFGFPQISMHAQAVEESVNEAASDAELRLLCSHLIEALDEVAQPD